MTLARTAIQDFSTANPAYENAEVTAYKVVDGAKSEDKADLYTSLSGAAKAANPQTLDSYGKFKQPLYIEEPVILTVEGLRNVPDHDTGIVNGMVKADVVLSAADILSLHTTPKTLISAPGAGKAILFLGAVAFYDYGTVAYTSVGAGDDITLRYTNGAGVVVGTLETTGFLDATADKYALVAPAGASLLMAANAALVASLGGAVATGDSPVALRVYYEIVDLSTLTTT